MKWLVMRPDLFNPFPKMEKTGTPEKFRDVVKQYWNITSSGTVGEMIDAVEHFLWQQENGIVMELGALSGGIDTFSQSQIFENFGWKRILIEGNPLYFNTSNLTEAAFVKSAICNKEMQVHYVIQHEKPMTSGIAEFMDQPILKHFHDELYKASLNRGMKKSFDMSRVNWNSLNETTFLETKCLPLDRILSTLGVRHINFFILDVEGAELEVLHSIDFVNNIFDVMVIEKNHNIWVHGASHPVEMFMADKPYRLVGSKGRNLWYHHVDFELSIRPDINKRCFRGCVRNYKKGCQPHFCSADDLNLNYR